MSENLFCDGKKILTQEGQDGWYRTFKGYPDINDDVKKMLYDYAKDGKYASILLFFINTCKYDTEYSLFLMREFERGLI